MKKVGLALSGGGALGLAHIGVIKTLVENNIPIDYIAGTSIGSFVGGIYAATKDVALLEKIALENNWREIFNIFFDPVFKGGLITGNKIIGLIEKHTGDIDISTLKIPFTAVATDFNTGQVVNIKKGKLCRAIRASIAVPVFFQPEILDNRILVDGGLSSPFPVETVKKMGADIVIGVNLYEDYLAEFKAEKIGMIPVLQQTMRIFLHNISKIESLKADVSITPDSKKMGWGKLMSRQGSQEGIDLGIKAAETKLHQIKSLMGKDKTGFLQKLFRFFIR